MAPDIDDTEVGIAQMVLQPAGRDERFNGHR
jgi:hypothetical protein